MQGTRGTSLGIKGVVIAACALATCAGCGPEPIVGVLQPLTGAAAIYGESIDNGMKLALNDAERCTMLPPGFQLVEVDTGSIPANAVAEYRRMVKGRVSLVMGGVTTDEAFALIPEVEAARVICLSPSVSATDISKKSSYFYRLFSTDEMEGMTAADYLFKKRLVRRLMIYTDGSLYTRGAESEFRQHFQLKQNGRIADTVHLRSPNWEQRSSDLLHAHNPEAVYIIGHAERILEVLRHLHQAGFDGVRCTTSTFFVNNVIEQAGELAEGVVFPLTSYNIDTGSDELRTFVEKYEERHGHKPDIFAAHGYDAMKVTIRTLNNAESLYPSGLRNAMAFKLDNLTGATGSLAFDDYGDVRRYPVMHIYHNGEVMSWSAYVDEVLAGLPKL